MKNRHIYKKRFKYIFTCDERFINVDKELFKFTLPNALPWIQKKKIYKKNKLVSFIGSNKKMCKGHLYRQEMIKKYEHKVDHFGRGFKDKELPWLTMHEDVEESGKIIGLKDYMFSFAMENTNHKFAFCEKTTDCFATGTIPVYWGGKGITKYFDKDGIIFLEELKSVDDLTEELYNSKMNSIKNNFEKLNNLLSAEDYFAVNHMRGHNDHM